MGDGTLTDDESTTATWLDSLDPTAVAPFCFDEVELGQAITAWHDEMSAADTGTTVLAAGLALVLFVAALGTWGAFLR
ncbi:MAG: hypothetical protein JWM89_1523 [Acidimicrobiales bacterium]|nr:hypothetical protein [Acidimicrobiales bacterium]